MMCAAPAYLARHGTPRTLAEVASHQCLSTLLLAADVAAGRLVQLFPQHGQAGRPMHVVYVHDRYRSTRQRSFLDFLMERFPPVPRL